MLSDIMNTSRHLSGIPEGKLTLSELEVTFLTGVNSGSTISSEIYHKSTTADLDELDM